MKKDLFWRGVYVFLVLINVLAPIVLAQTPLPECVAGGDPQVACTPPTMRWAQILAVQLLAVVWGMTGAIFFFLFVYNGYLYMANKLEDAKKRMVQWIIGIILVFFSRPIVATIMKIVISDQVTCYAELNEPRFQFFFPDVCTTLVPAPTP